MKPQKVKRKFSNLPHLGFLDGKVSNIRVLSLNPCRLLSLAANPEKKSFIKNLNILITTTAKSEILSPE